MVKVRFRVGIQAMLKARLRVAFGFGFMVRFQVERRVWDWVMCRVQGWVYGQV
jgi:hypothetical protein